MMKPRATRESEEGESYEPAGQQRPTEDLHNGGRGGKAPELPGSSLIPMMPQNSDASLPRRDVSLNVDILTKPIHKPKLITPPPTFQTTEENSIYK